MSKMLSDDQVFDRARYVAFDDELIYVWKGGHTVNVYISDELGEYTNTDAFSVGDFAKNEATLEEVQRGIGEHGARAMGLADDE